MRLREAISALRSLTLENASEWRKLKNLIGRDLEKSGLDGNRSFETVGRALAVIGSVLAKYGVEWDDVLSADLFRGDKGFRTLKIAFTNQSDLFSPRPIENSLVRVDWHRHQSGTFEVIAYLT